MAVHGGFSLATRPRLIGGALAVLATASGAGVRKLTIDREHLLGHSSFNIAYEKTIILGKPSSQRCK
jgi:hypothetical protein